MAELESPRNRLSFKQEGRVMKKKEIILANIILAVLIIGFGYLTFKLSTNQSPFQAFSSSTSKKDESVKNCSDKAPLTIGNTTDVHLKKLDDYQKACNSFVTNKLMIFISFADDNQTAEANAAALATKLIEFHKVGVSPIVIVEPYIKDSAMSYKTYLAGAYDAPMEHFFNRLKELGVTDSMMGMWVPFPESNTPNWNNADTEPSDFAHCVNKFLAKAKQHFPGISGSVLLNATTYEPTDVNWENGNYLGLNEYTGLLDDKLVDSFGIQGFPWVSNAQQVKRTIFSAYEFLQPDFAIGAAQGLRTRDIWINTGAFASKYTNDPAKTVHLSINERKALLNSILEIATYIRDYQQNQYRVTINLFSEDKSESHEATDWSYSQDIESQTVLKDFLTQADELDIPIAIYDKAK
jgi:hypothetical protein